MIPPDLFLSVYIRVNFRFRFQNLFHRRFLDHPMPPHTFFDQFRDLQITDLPAKNNATAFSLAAFKTVGSDPPVRPASYASFNP